MQPSKINNPYYVNTFKNKIFKIYLRELFSTKIDIESENYYVIEHTCTLNK